MSAEPESAPAKQIDQVKAHYDVSTCKLKYTCNRIIEQYFWRLSFLYFEMPTY